MLTEQQLAEIEARDRARTPGAWRVYSQHGSKEWAVGRCTSTGRPLYGVHVDGIFHEGDAAFIAACSVDVPLLTAEVRRLQALLAEAMPALEAFEDALSELDDERARQIRIRLANERAKRH